MINRKDMRDLICEEDGIGVVEIILILVVLIMLIVIFRKQITDIVSSAFKNINGDSDTINEEIEIDDAVTIEEGQTIRHAWDLCLENHVKTLYVVKNLQMGQYKQNSQL